MAVLGAAPDWCKPLEKERPQYFSDRDADAEEKSPKLLRTLLGTSLERWPGSRGPRNAVLN